MSAGLPNRPGLTLSMGRTMKLGILAAVAGLPLGAPMVQAQDSGPREVREITSGWRFQIDAHDLGEREHWYDPTFDRSGWREAEVPRAWDLFDEAMRGYEGIGWYSMTLDGSWARDHKVQHLTFGRVMYHTRAWLNGELLGEHVDGYLPFAFDVTGRLKDSANHLVLRVDNRPRIEWPPAAKQIEWVQYGGILQPVRIESRALVSITDLTIRAVPEGNDASVACSVQIRAGQDLQDLVLRLRIVGIEPSVQTLTVATRQGTTSRHELTLKLTQARIWSPESPSLYSLVATLERGDTVIDRITSPFGIRTIAARGRQILLNGKPLKIKGVNRYDEFGRFGPNPPMKLVEDELRLMKRTGINLIRTHYPQAPEVLQLCDRLGLLFLEELPINWWGVDWFGKDGLVQDEHILDYALPMLETMIRRDRNHPCLIIWSMANESRTDNEVGIKVMRTLIGRTKALDPTRLVTFVTAPGSVREHRAYEDADLVATNMYYGSLGGKIAFHGNQLEERTRRPSEEHLRRQITAFPDKPMLITEFGAIGILGMHGDVAETEDFQADYIRSAWKAIAAVPEVSGGVLWSWADYYHRRQFQANGPFGAFGAVTIDRRLKAALKALSAIYGGEPD
jgi:beta-galactosidase/beta-glucuronidase